jgi:hypothetical protein
VGFVAGSVGMVGSSAVAVWVVGVSGVAVGSCFLPQATIKTVSATSSSASTFFIKCSFLKGEDKDILFVFLQIVNIDKFVNY